MRGDAAARRDSDDLRERQARADRRAEARPGRRLRGRGARHPPAGVLGRRGRAGRRLPGRRPLRLQLRRAGGDVAPARHGGRRRELHLLPHAVRAVGADRARRRSGAAGRPSRSRPTVVTANAGKAADEGRFYARWRRENPCVEGRALHVSEDGQGAATSSASSSRRRGSSRAARSSSRATTAPSIDGELAVPGTGCEDSFNGGWYDVPGRWEMRRRSRSAVVSITRSRWPGRAATGSS
ncbi:MAG: DUF2961 domain-containing protein [Candidatus Moduliflexus flocculans]|nr:DUF2961 domain-containing protein [Candidatus Moduliflexus flocculans]